MNERELELTSSYTEEEKMRFGFGFWLAKKILSFFGIDFFFFKFVG